jgi:hypothetical protein
VSARPRRRLHAALLGAVLAVAPRPEARADEPDPRPEAGGGKDRDAAREKAAAGLEHFEAKRWAEAYTALEQADRLFHAPTLTLAMAQCQEAMGRLLAARALYRKVQDEPLPAKAPEQFRTARATAQAALEALAKRIPTLTVTVTGPGAAGARVQIDGADVSAAELAAGREIDPGDHVVTAETDSARARLAVKLPEGAATRAELGLTPVSTPAAPAPARPGSLVPAGIAFGAGAAGLAAGAVTGIAALSIGGDIRSRCRTIAGELHCLAADIPARDTASALATTSTIALVAGGAAALTGVVLAIVRPGGGSKPVEVTVSAGSVHLRGSF